MAENDNIVENVETFRGYKKFIENQLGEFLRNGLVRNFQDLDQWLKSPVFDISTQQESIREYVMTCYASSRTENGEAGIVSPSTQNIRNFPSNGFIAQLIKVAVPRITEFNKNINLVQSAGNILVATPLQIGSANGQNIQFMDDTYFKGRLSPLVSSMKELKETAVKFHERTSIYHERRARLIYEFIQNDETAVADALLAVSDLDVTLYLAIHDTLANIRDLYGLLLAFDNVLGR